MFIEVKLGGKLANGKLALIDLEDSNLVNAMNWSMDTDGYAVANGTRLKMHRLIMKAPKGSLVDHINRDRLDNRKVNLRIVTVEQNTWNHSHKVGKSGVRGVRKRSNRWEAFLSVKDKFKYLGYFKTLEEAKAAREQAEKELRVI